MASGIASYSRFVFVSVRSMFTGGPRYLAWLGFLVCLIAMGVFAYYRQTVHGLGVTAMTQRTGAEFAAVVDFARQQRTSLVEAEMQLLEFHHGELGGRILREWKLPRVFADVVEFYPESFEEGEVSPEAAELIAILREAIEIARAIGFGDSGDHTPRSSLRELAVAIGLKDLACNVLASRAAGVPLPQTSAMTKAVLPSRRTRKS